MKNRLYIKRKGRYINDSIHLKETILNEKADKNKKSPDIEPFEIDKTQ